MMRKVAIFLLLVPLGCTDRPAPRPADRLLNLMNRRLELMHEVARWKWNEKKPIDDPERERALLEDVARRGEAAGLDPEFVRAFFGDQIEAAKVVQRGDFERWKVEKRGSFPNTRDLASLREEIDRLNTALVEALAAVDRETLAEAARQADGLPEVALRAILRSSEETPSPQGR